MRKSLPVAYVKWFKPHSDWKNLYQKTGLHALKKEYYKGFNIISVYRLARGVITCPVGKYLLVSEILRILIKHHISD